MALVGGVLVEGSRDDAGSRDDVALPARAEDPPSAGTREAAAEEIATSFLEAIGVHDTGAAIGYLADDDGVVVDLWPPGGSRYYGGDLHEDRSLPDGRRRLRLQVALLDAQGHEQMLDPCEKVPAPGSGAAPSPFSPPSPPPPPVQPSDADTSFDCFFRFHALGSDQLGFEPFGGSWFNVTVRDGAVVQVAANFEVREFSGEVWEPFARWVAATHPDDAVVMYEDASHHDARLTEESIRLWTQHTRGFIEEAGVLRARRREYTTRVQSICTLAHARLNEQLIAAGVLLVSPDHRDDGLRLLPADEADSRAYASASARVLQDALTTLRAIDPPEPDRSVYEATYEVLERVARGMLNGDATDVGPDTSGRLPIPPYLTVVPPAAQAIQQVEQVPGVLHCTFEWPR